jgi:hypothetical protein
MPEVQRLRAADIPPRRSHVDALLGIEADMRWLAFILALVVGDMTE